MSEQSEIKPTKVQPPRIITEIDVLQHFAATATFPYHKRKFVDPPVTRKRIRIPKQKNPYKKPQHMIDAEEREQDEARKRASSVSSQSDYRAAPVPSGSRHLDSPRNILPPPPPPIEDPIPETSPEPIEATPEEIPSGEVSEEPSQEPSSIDPRPQWNYASTPLPPHLQRQAQLLPPAAPSTISEEDAMEVDELATPGDGKADIGAEDGILTGSPAGKGRRSDPGGNLLSLPRRLWSSIRPGILS
jgi:hypothetical protein